MTDSMRLDKWLWVARFYRTRALATEAAGRGRIAVNGQPAKAGRELRCGDRVAIEMTAWNTRLVREVTVLALMPNRGPASTAETLYAESAASLVARAEAYAQRAQHAEPAQAIHGKPSRRDRDALVAAARPDVPDWDDRWSAHWPDDHH